MLDTLVGLERPSEDFSVSGRRSFSKTFQDGLGNHLLVKTTAVLGPNAKMGCEQEAIHLNGLLRPYFPGQRR